MGDKYTLRDFLVYFITGLFILITLMYRFDISLLEFFRITKTDIKDNSALTIFLLVPGLYHLGHIIHGIDLLAFKIGRYIWDFKEHHKTKLKKLKILWLFNFINIIINGNRVTGILNSKSEDTNVFWKRVSELQYKGKYDKSEYWNLMNDLFKGLTLISISWSIFYYYECNKLNAIISTVLSFLFWYRARHMATNFVATVNNTWNTRE